MSDWGFKYTVSVYCEGLFNKEKHDEVMLRISTATRLLDKLDYVDPIGIMVDLVDEKPKDPYSS